MINEKYSGGKDFSNQVFTHLPPSEFDGMEIKGSCFYQHDKPNTLVFPIIKGVVFNRCNLDNVLINTSKNTIMSNCCHRQIRQQNDMEPWVLNDNTLLPEKPVNEKQFDKVGLSKSPLDIPADFIRREFIVKSEWLRTIDTVEFKRWFSVRPQIIVRQTRMIRRKVLKSKWDTATDKSKWIKDFDSVPTQTVKSLPARVVTKAAVVVNNVCVIPSEFGLLSKEYIILAGEITKYEIAGKGTMFIEGEKRPCENLPATVEKSLQNNQNDVDSLKAYNPNLAKRLGIE